MGVLTRRLPTPGTLLTREGSLAVAGGGRTAVDKPPTEGAVWDVCGWPKSWTGRWPAEGEPGWARSRGFEEEARGRGAGVGGLRMDSPHTS